MSLIWQKRIIIILGVLGVSMAPIFIRLCQREVTQVTIGFSLFIAASRLIFTGILLTPTYGNLKKVDNSNKQITYAIAAGVCLAFHFATWITSLKFTSVAASVSIVTTNPLWVALLSWYFWRQKISLKTWIGISIAIVGSVIVAFSGEQIANISNNPLFGAILALVGSWCASGYIFLGTIAQQKGLATNQYIAIAYLTAAICLFPMPLLFGSGYLGYPTIVYLYIMLMAIVSQIIGHTSLNWCLKHFSPTSVSILVLLEPLISSVLVWWLFTEIPSLSVILGGLILSIGVLISVTKSNNNGLSQ